MHAHALTALIDDFVWNIILKANKFSFCMSIFDKIVKLILKFVSYRTKIAIF